MKNLSLKAMLSCIKITNDYDLTALVKPQFSKQYGDPAFATVKDILRKEGDLNIAEACTSLMAVISDVDAVAEILSIIPDVRKEDSSFLFLDTPITLGIVSVLDSFFITSGVIKVILVSIEKSSPIKGRTSINNPSL